MSEILTKNDREELLKQLLEERFGATRPENKESDSKPR